MVTVQRSFLALTNAVTTVNDRWPAVILSAAVYYILGINDTSYNAHSMKAERNTVPLADLI